MSETILFVDDEPNVLKSLRRTFIESGYELEFAIDGEEALRIIKEKRVDMVVADMRMPKMDGYRLLSEIRKIQPRIIRIILSGYVEKKDLLRVVADGTAKAYLTKPWDNEKIVDDIRGIMKAYESTRHESVLALINTIDRLPVLPSVYQKILSLLESDASMEKISSYIETVPDYAARVLRTVNSAFYGISTGSVKHAIVYLGLDAVKNIVLATETFSELNGSTELKADNELIWEHSSLCNKLFNAFYYRLFGKRTPEEFAAAGLLHDVGRLIIMKYFTDEFKEINVRWESDMSRSLTSIERDVIGASHTQLGAYLLDWWNLPSHICEACLYHHGPFNEKLRNREIIGVIHAADIYSWRCLTKDSRMNPDAEVCSLLCTNEKEFEKMSEEILSE